MRRLDREHDSAYARASSVRSALLSPLHLIRSLGVTTYITQSHGVIIRCLTHIEAEPSCSVYVAPDGTIAYRCHGCGATGDALSLIAAARGLDLRSQFRAVLSIAAEIAGSEISDAAPTPNQSPRSVAYPSDAALLQLARCCSLLPPSGDMVWRGLCWSALYGSIRWLQSDSDIARTAKYSWIRTGHRVIVPVYDHTLSTARSVRGWRVDSAETRQPRGPKRLPPYGFSTRGLAMANTTARLSLHDRPLLIVEGEPDYLTWITRTADPVIGIINGSLTAIMLEAFGAADAIYLRTHRDRAGDAYADTIARAVKCPVYRLAGHSEEDENDRLQKGTLEHDYRENCIQYTSGSTDLKPH